MEAEKGPYSTPGPNPGYNQVQDEDKCNSINN